MTQQKLALFIDANSTPAEGIEYIMATLSSYGQVSIKRAYGNWKSRGLNVWETVLHEHAIQPIQQFDLEGKETHDIALTIEIMDILYTKDIDTYCIVSSHTDFARLATRLMNDGKTVIGAGTDQSPESFIKSCSSFLNLSTLTDNAASKTKRVPATKTAAKSVTTTKKAAATTKGTTKPKTTTRASTAKKTTKKPASRAKKPTKKQEKPSLLGKLKKVLG